MRTIAAIIISATKLFTEGPILAEDLLVWFEMDGNLAIPIIGGRVSVTLTD